MSLLWHTGYDPPPDQWIGQEVPSAGGVQQPDRLQRVPAPGPAQGRPVGQVLRFELHPGDTWTDASGYVGNRCEVFGRAGSPWSAPGDQWPDPAGSVRWYGFRLFIPADFQTVTTADPWFTFTQWKGLRGGSPPIALEVKRSGLRLGGQRTNVGLIPGDGNLGPIVKGSWTQLVVGLSLSPDPAVGWVEVWRDGTQALARSAVATMDVVNGQTDPVYLKQGIYRDGAWTVPHVLYFGPTTIGTTRSDVT